MTITFASNLSARDKEACVVWTRASGASSWTRIGPEDGLTFGTNTVTVPGTFTEGTVCKVTIGRLSSAEMPITIPEQVTVSFDTDYGDSVSPMTVTSGQGITCPTDITKYAYQYYGFDDGAFTLEGWYRDAAKTVRYNDGDPITANTTLYAKWTDNRVITTGSLQTIRKNRWSGYCYFDLELGDDSKIGLIHEDAQIHPLYIRTRSYVKPKTPESVITVYERYPIAISWPLIQIDNNIEDIVSETTGPWEGQIFSVGPDGSEVASDWFDIDVVFIDD